MSFLTADEKTHEISHRSGPGRRAVRVTKYCEYRELFNEAKIGRWRLDDTVHLAMRSWFSNRFCSIGPLGIMIGPFFMALSLLLVS